MKFLNFSHSTFRRLKLWPSPIPTVGWKILLISTKSIRLTYKGRDINISWLWIFVLSWLGDGIEATGGEFIGFEHKGHTHTHTHTHTHRERERERERETTFHRERSSAHECYWKLISVCLDDIGYMEKVVRTIKWRYILSWR